MKVAIDISPLQTGHKVRGVGFYVKYLKEALEKYFPYITFTFFTQTKNVPNAADIIHFPYFEPFFLTLPFFKKKNIVVTVHDVTPLLFPKDFPVGVKGKVKWMVQKYLLRKVDAIITDSNTSKKDIGRILGYPTDNIFVASLAAADHFKTISDKKELQRVKSFYHLPDAFLLYVGDITPNKNIPRLVKAALRTKLPLVMVGKALANEHVDIKNPWNKDLKELMQLVQNTDQIIRLGFVSDADLVALYNLASAFVMPSLYEGFGLPILEAMSCGCPVITSKEGSLPEVAGNAAYFVDAYSVDSITHAIQKVVGDKQLAKKMKISGIEQAKKFTWEKTAEATVAVYKKIYER